MTQHAFKPLLLNLLRHAQISQNAFFQQLPPEELTVIGTPEHWSAKDNVAHMTFWRRRLILRLQAIIRQEPPPEGRHSEELNPLVFEENRYRPWSMLLSESDEAYAELIELVPYLSEEDLTASSGLLEDGMPLYTSFMGNCYEHTQIHLAEYLVDHGETERALEIYKDWTDRVVEMEVPATLKGNMLYNLACFYATHNRLEEARPILEQAFTLYPETREFALTDPDLVDLHLHPSD